MHIEFAQYRRNVGLDRGFGDIQGVGNLFVRFAFGHALEHQQLLAGQGLEHFRREARGVVVAPAGAAFLGADDVGRQVHIAIEDLLDRFDHL